MRGLISRRRQKRFHAWSRSRKSQLPGHAPLSATSQRQSNHSPSRGVRGESGRRAPAPAVQGNRPGGFSRPAGMAADREAAPALEAAALVTWRSRSSPERGLPPQARRTRPKARAAKGPYGSAQSSQYPMGTEEAISAAAG